MAPEWIIARLLLAASVLILAAGATAAWASANVIKRVVGIMIAFAGALLALAVLGVGAAAAAGLAAAFAYVVLGVAMVVRLQEGYSAIEAGALDAADSESEPAERRA